jgi:hypothetical protein
MGCNFVIHILINKAGAQHCKSAASRLVTRAWSGLAQLRSVPMALTRESPTCKVI